MPVRDAHEFPATVVLVPALLVVAWPGAMRRARLPRTMVAGAIAILLAPGYAYVAESPSNRALLSCHHAVGVRILPDPVLTKWFDEHGMPLDDALRTRTGRSGLDDAFYRSTDPAFARYRSWAEGSGRRALVLSMVLQAPHYRDLMYEDLPSLLKGDVRYYDTYGVYDRLPE